VRKKGGIALDSLCKSVVCGELQRVMDIGRQYRYGTHNTCELIVALSTVAHVLPE
jgi:hypothetical protein